MNVGASRLVEWNGPSGQTAAEPASGVRPCLSALAPGRAASVVVVSLDAHLVRWLEAIGIGAGDRVTVLRRAAFGGPIHLRTQTGGEFAIDRALAANIHVEADVAAPDPA